MIPYFEQPSVHLGPFHIYAWGVLAAVNALLAFYLIVRRAMAQGISGEEMFRFCFTMFATGIIGAHLASAIMDNPSRFWAHPMIALLSAGIRSLGGVLVGFLGGLAWCRLAHLSLFETLRRFDIVLYPIPFAWMFGRLGCFLAHDHRGFFTTSWIAVNFPEGPRYDLGLIEFLFLIPLALVFYLLDRRPRPVGFFIGLYGVVYGGFRIWLDTLHVEPLRFGGWAVVVAIGLLCWAISYRQVRRRQPFQQTSAAPTT